MKNVGIDGYDENGVYTYPVGPDGMCSAVPCGCYDDEFDSNGRYIGDDEEDSLHIESLIV